MFRGTIYTWITHHMSGQSNVKRRYDIWWRYFRPIAGKFNKIGLALVLQPYLHFKPINFEYFTKTMLGILQESAYTEAQERAIREDSENDLS